MNDVNIECKKRMPNIEVLRCIAMMMVIVLHYLGKGELLPELTTERIEASGIVAWLLESFCIVAVNLYMLISGYFLCESSFKMSRLIKLWLQIWTYSAVIGIISAYIGIIPANEVDTHYFLTVLFPVSMGHYWFMTAYFFLYILLPLLGTGLRNLTKKQMQIIIIVLISVFSITKTILPVRLEMDGQGYDVLWYLCVFVIAAYIRKYGITFLSSAKKAMLLYIIGCLLLFAEAMLIRIVYLKTDTFGRIVGISYEYNHLLPLLASIGIFIAFLKWKVPEHVAKVVIKIAPYSLGVYLLHENIGLRYAWQGWLGADKVTSAIAIVLYTVMVVIVVFFCGISVEMVRTNVMKLLHRILMKNRFYRKIEERVVRIDMVFAKGK